MIPRSTSGISFSRILSRQTSHIRMRPSIPMCATGGNTTGRRGFVSVGGSAVTNQSTDEMSAALAQFRNRRDYEKTSNLSNSFERVLEDEVYRRRRPQS